jgi:hypothetical protein
MPKVPYPTAWTGRAVQAECEQMDGVGLARLALACSVCAPGHHGYSTSQWLDDQLFLSATPDAHAAIVFCGTLAIGLATSV